MSRPLFRLSDEELASIKRRHKTSYRIVIEKFERDGVSQHSGRGLTVLWITDYCYRNGIQFSVDCMPGMGYFVRKIDNKDS